MVKQRFALVLLFAMLVLNAMPASAWDIEWVDQFGNATSTSTSSVSTDATGVYVTGATFGALPGQVGSGGVDSYLRKYDFAGNALWTKQFGTPGTDFGRGVATDPSGAYLAGRTTGTLPAQISAGDSDAFVRKYSPNGDVLWTHQFGTSGFDAPWFNGVATHATGVYAAGETSGTFPGEPGGNGVDFFVARLDAQTGQLIWVRQFGNRSDFLLTIGGVSTDDSGVYVTGTTALGQGFTITSLIRKYDFDGNFLWSREFLPAPGASCSGTLWAISAHGGNVYVTGQWDERYFDYAFQEPAGACGKNGLALGTGTSVGVLLKYDSAGNLLWQRRIKGAGEGSDSFTGAKVVWASDAGVFVGANLTTTFPGHLPSGPRLDHRECPGLAQGQGNSFVDKLDAYVRRYDFDGNVIWTHQFGSSVFDLVTGLGSDATSVYVAGDTSCQIESAETFSGGVRDAFVLRIASEPTSRQGQVQLIVGRLETLSDAGVLGAGDFDSLVKHLEASLAAVDRGDNQVARQSLEAFITAVGNMESRGTLSSADAAALVAAANAVIGQL